MHPYYPGFRHWHSMGHWHRGPSRLFWFIIGAASTAWWLKYKDIHHHDRYFGHCFRPPVQAPPPPFVQSTVPSDSNLPRGDNTLGAEAPHVRRPRNIPEARPPQGPAPWGFGQQRQAQQWEEEKEHMWALGRQAGDTVRTFYCLPMVLSQPLLLSF